MSDRIETFEVGEHVQVVAATRSGDITVVGGPPGSVRVAIDGGGAGNYDIDQIGDVVTVEPRRKGRFRGSSVDIVLTVPESSTAELSCTSGDILVQGPVAELRASVASGDVRVDTVETVCKVNSASGDIRVNRALDAEINTASGTVRLGQVDRALRLNAASGNVYAVSVGDSAMIKVASSDIRISSFEGSDISVKTMSGDLHLGIPPRRTVELDFSSLSGRLRNKLPASDGSPSEKTVQVMVAAVSGDLTLTAAKS
jgi:DUF4097 and DUF4098 domain-containing protein YvlB